MTTKHKPATPLPYAHKSGHEGKTSAIVSATGFVVAGSLVARALQRDADNHAYIAHAANAYPKLVDFVRTLTTDKHQTGAAAETLLRELGEE